MTDKPMTDAEALAILRAGFSDTNEAAEYALQHIATRLAQQPKCVTCGGRGEIGGHVGQTPESFDYVTEPCPECGQVQPARGGEAWRCFHCDEVFTDQAAAAEHFGTKLRHEPACTIDPAEHRRLEDREADYAEEDASVHRAMRRMETEHRSALEREEIKGYERGLRDSGKCPCAQPRTEQPAGEAVQLTACCGREECGGECGNEWRGMEWVRVRQEQPAAEGWGEVVGCVEMHGRCKKVRLTDASVPAGTKLYAGTPPCADAVDEAMARRAEQAFDGYVTAHQTMAPRHRTKAAWIAALTAALNSENDNG